MVYMVWYGLVWCGILPKESPDPSGEKMGVLPKESPDPSGEQIVVLHLSYQTIPHHTICYGMVVWWYGVVFYGMVWYVMRCGVVKRL